MQKDLKQRLLKLVEKAFSLHYRSSAVTSGFQDTSTSPRLFTQEIKSPEKSTRLNRQKEYQGINLVKFYGFLRRAMASLMGRTLGSNTYGEC